MRLFSDWREGISQFPQAGRVVPELANPNVRERFVYSYRVIYEVRGDLVEVLTVIHGKRLLEA
ncbi:MAG: type II toxin-antitoxin system RelE/ParE family toxin [Steroidobacteraceae bacterium]